MTRPQRAESVPGRREPRRRLTTSGARAPSVAAGLAILAGCGGAAEIVRTPSEAAPLVVHLERIESTTELERALREEAREVVEADVESRRAARHGELPDVDRSEAETPDAWPGLAVRNDTPHGLVVWFAGPCPRTVAIPPGGAFEGEVCEGTYDIAAELASEDYVPFVGEENALENGYAYSLTFYVLARPRTRTRRFRR